MTKNQAVQRGTWNVNKTGKLPYDLALMEAIKDMVFIVSVEMGPVLKYEFFNQAVFERTHLTRNDAGKTFKEVFDPATATLLNKQYKKAFETEECVVYEDSYLSSSRESYYSETTITPLFDQKGQCTHLIGVVKDKTGEWLTKRENEEAWGRLKESRSRYRSLYENNIDAIFSLDLNGQILTGNSTVEKMTGCPLDNFIDTNFSNHIIEKDHELLSIYYQLALSGISHDFRTKFIRCAGKAIGVLIHFAPVKVQEEIVGVYATLKDMTELDKMFDQYSESENRFRIIAENAHDVIVLMNHEGESLYVSPSSKRVYGLDPEEHLSMPPFHNIHPEDIAQVKEAFSLAIQNAETYIVEVRRKHKSKGWIWTEMQGTPVFDEEQQFVHMLTISQDITLHKEREMQLQHYAYHDSLTGLPNRRFLKNFLSEKINQSTEADEVLTVILLDIDHFKEINDQFGHEIGDAVIEEFGNRLRQSIDEHDFAARLGGDEFILVLPDIKTVEQAKRMAIQIQETVALPWDMEGDSLEVKVSMGIALTPLAGATGSSILKNADVAMYESKEAGRGTYRIHCL